MTTDESSDEVPGYTFEEMRKLQADILKGKDRLLSPGEVASMCKVDPKTVTRWSKAHKLRCIRLNGANGHRRYSEREVYLKVFGCEPPKDV